jgi:2-methylisocitrate lyase-like PEP mutase family enzyme
MMSDSPNRVLRTKLQRGAGLLIPGAANALTARVIEQLGFDALLVTGAGIANTFLGVPDIGLLTVTELTDHVGAMRDAVELPMIVDIDTGFGNAVNVGRTIKCLERAGASAFQLEDQTFPKRCGHFDGKDVIPVREMVQKIKAAVDARKDRDVMILARTDARAVKGLKDALDRANAYREAGADMLFVEAPQSVEELAAIPREVPGIHICNMVFGGKTPLLPREELAKMGYAGIIYANAALQASILAMQNVLGHIKRTGSTAGVENAIAPFKDRQRVVNFDRYKDLGRSYATD